MKYRYMHIPYAIERELRNYLCELLIQYYSLKCNDNKDCIITNLKKIKNIISLNIREEQVQTKYHQHNVNLYQEIISTLQFLYNDETVELVKKLL